MIYKEQRGSISCQVSHTGTLTLFRVYVEEDAIKQGMKHEADARKIKS